MTQQHDREMDVVMGFLGDLGEMFEGVVLLQVQNREIEPGLALRAVVCAAVTAVLDVAFSEKADYLRKVSQTWRRDTIIDGGLPELENAVQAIHELADDHPF